MRRLLHLATGLSGVGKGGTLWSKKAHRCDDGMHIHKHSLLTVGRLGARVQEYIEVPVLVNRFECIELAQHQMHFLE